jgi:retron-type reverse transcriptase
MKDFSPTWCQWIASFMEGGHVGIKINDQVGQNFQTKKGVRQEDPLSPILFNIVIDMLAILIKRAKGDGQIAGEILHLIDDGLSILQYADDTILFMEHDIEKAKNMKLLLSVFKQLLGLKINFYKSEIFCFGQAKDYELQYEQLFRCKKVSYPFKYLGIHMHYRRLNNKD